MKPVPKGARVDPGQMLARGASQFLGKLQPKDIVRTALIAGIAYGQYNASYHLRDNTKMMRLLAADTEALAIAMRHILSGVKGASEEVAKETAQGAGTWLFNHPEVGLYLNPLTIGPALGVTGYRVIGAEDSIEDLTGWHPGEYAGRVKRWALGW